MTKEERRMFVALHRWRSGTDGFLWRVFGRTYPYEWVEKGWVKSRMIVPASMVNPNFDRWYFTEAGDEEYKRMFPVRARLESIWKFIKNLFRE